VSGGGATGVIPIAIGLRGCWGGAQGGHTRLALVGLNMELAWRRRPSRAVRLVVRGVEAPLGVATRPRSPFQGPSEPRGAHREGT